MAALAAGVSSLLAGCGLRVNPSYRFQMIVEVTTPDGILSGASVYEVTAGYKVGMDPSGKIREWRLKGEAVAVDLPGGQTLFALLRTAGPKSEDLALVSMAALDPAFRNDVIESAARIARGEGRRSPVTLASSDQPIVIGFRNIADPKSVYQIDTGTETVNGRSFAPKVRVQLKRTTDPVTGGLENRLPWLRKIQGALEKIPLDDYPPPGTPLPLAANLNDRDFSRDMLK